VGLIGSERMAGRSRISTEISSDMNFSLAPSEMAQARESGCCYKSQTVSRELSQRDVGVVQSYEWRTAYSRQTKGFHLRTAVKSPRSPGYPAVYFTEFTFNEVVSRHRRRVFGA